MEWKLKKFNELELDELYEILRVRGQVFVVEQESAYLDCDNKDKQSYHLFSIEDGKILSYVRILDKEVSYNEMSIGRVLVQKEARKLGLARKTLQKAIFFIIDNKKEDSIRISAQSYLTNFYKSLGFKEVGNIYDNNGIPHIEMLYTK